MAHTDEGFLSRWSRLKRTGAAQAKEGQGDAAPQVQPAQPITEAARDRQPDEVPQTPLDLPDVASLTKDSDFTVFLRANVPEHLHRDALRALWKSDPIFSHHDGLTDYAEDFANPEVVGSAVKTAWTIGRGFLDAPDESSGVAETRDEGGEPSTQAADGEPDAPV